MAVEHRKSSFITNRDSTPKVITNAAIAGAVLKEKVGLAVVTSSDSIDSTYRICEIPSNARIAQVLIYSPDIGTTAITDVGIYRTTADGGAVVDQDFIASAVSLKDGALVGADVTHESATGMGSIANGEKRIWEALSLTADPGIVYDVTLTLTAASDATATAKIVVRYVE